MSVKPIPSLRTEIIAAIANNSVGAITGGILQGAIIDTLDTLDASDAALLSAITSETTARTTADASLDAALDLLAGDIGELATDQSTGIAALSSAVASEASTRSAADTSLAAAITAEASTARAAEALKLDKSGGTMTGSLTASAGISTTTLTTSGAVTVGGALTSGGAVTSLGHITSGDGTGTRYLTIDGGAGSARMFRFRSGGVNRAALYVDSVAEDGANAGSNLQLDLYSDAGAWLRAWLRVVRATGASTINGDTTISGSLTANGGISTTTLTTSGAVTFGSSAQFNGEVTVGTDTASRQFRLNGPAGSYRQFAFKTAGTTRQMIQLTNTDNFEIQDYDSAGAWVRSWLIHNPTSNVTTLQCSLAVDSITNYAAAVATAQLLALTPAQSAAKRLATVSDCYGLDGTFGVNLAVWKGDSSAGVWVIAGTSVPITRDRLTFLRGLAKAGLQSICAKICAGPLSRNGRQDFALASSGTVGSWQSEPATLTFRVQTTGSYLHRATGSDNLTVATGGYHYSRCKVKVSRQGTMTDNAFTWFGLVQHPTNYPASATAHQAIVCHDAQNGAGILGANNGNLFLVVGNGTNGTAPVDLGAAPVGSTVIVEMFTSGASSIDVYINEVLAVSVATNLPTVGGIGMMWDTGARSTAYASTPTDSSFSELFQAVMF